VLRESRAEAKRPDPSLRDEKRSVLIRTLPSATLLVQNRAPTDAAGLVVTPMASSIVDPFEHKFND